MFPFSPGKFLSHTLIVAAFLVSIASVIEPTLVDIFGFRGAVLFSGNISSIIASIVLFQFFHGSLLHLLFNTYFLYIQGPIVEMRMSKKRYGWFFVTTTIFVAFGLAFFESPSVITIGISGFCMAILSYLWLDLLTIRHPQAHTVGFFLLLNIALGISTNISFFGHLFGAIWGIIWWLFRDKTHRINIFQ